MVTVRESARETEPSTARMHESVFIVLAAVLLTLTICRCLLAVTTDLAEDEAYYWLWSRPLALSYYDHPPMIAYWVRAGTSIFGDTTFGVRVIGLLSVLAGSYLLYETSLSLFRDRTAAALSVIWLNSTLLCNAASILATPDTPLAFFIALTLFGLAKLIEKRDARYWLLIGTALGCAFLSKYTAALLLPGLALWLFGSSDGRVWLRRFELYVGAALAFLIATPVFIWNYQHGWASFAKQARHGVKDKPASALQSVGELVGGQAGLVTPLIFMFCLFGIGFALWHGLRKRDERWLLVGLISAPPLLFFLIHAASQKIQPNWPGFIWGTAIIAGVGAIAELGRRSDLPMWVRATYRAAPIVALILTAGAFLQLGLSVLPIPSKKDPTSRLRGWSSLVHEIGAIRAQNGADVILTDRYAITGEIAYYLSDSSRVWQVKERIRYANLAPLDARQLKDKPSLLVVRHGQDISQVSPFFENQLLVTSLTRNAGFQPQDVYDVYVLSHYRGGLF